MDLQAALPTFVNESRDLLADMERALLEFGQSADRRSAVNAVFRAAHTIKGSAGLFGFEHVVNFAHAIESLLDAVRDERVDIDDSLVVLLLSCCDHLGEQVEALAQGRREALAPQHTELLVQQLARCLPEPAVAVSTAPPAAAPVPRAVDDGLHWHLSLRLSPDVLRQGLDPLPFVRYLNEIGRIVGIVTQADTLPDDPAAMDPETCYLGFEIALVTSLDKAGIEAVFEFLRDDCTLHIIAPSSRVADLVALIAALPEKPARLGEILIECGSITPRELEAALGLQAMARREQVEPAPLGRILVEQQAVHVAVVDAALRHQQQLGSNREPRGGPLRLVERGIVRVDAMRLDQLVDLVGELSLCGAGVQALSQSRQDGELREWAERLEALVQQVRDRALGLRMVRIGDSLARFQRLVHDAARELGKDIQLRISGEDSELDKALVERIGEPLLHLVRNAVDHGIEMPELRRARGKPAQGLLRLHARHDADNIVIEVGDDGGGLDGARIFAKAVERGLVATDAQLSEAEIFELIFEPGFSTAATVTELSGRGVGMDAVRRHISALRGTVSVSSKLGLGTTVSVRLPLTLAIIRGFLVQVGGAALIVPMDAVEECVALQSEPGHELGQWRGASLPLLDLRQVFAIDGEVPRRRSVVVVQQAGHSIGLVVDQLRGECQAVIKPLAPALQALKLFSGSTLLGDGSVALILDMAALLASGTERNRTKETCS